MEASNLLLLACQAAGQRRESIEVNRESTILSFPDPEVRCKERNALTLRGGRGTFLSRGSLRSSQGYTLSIKNVV